MTVLTTGSYRKERLVEILEKRTNYTDWKDKISVLNQTVFDIQRDNYNMSAMYLTQQAFTDRFLSAQKKLQIRGYYVAQSGLFRSLVAYLVNEEFPFLERLNEIFHWMRNAGLDGLWLRQDDDVYEQNLLKLNHERIANETNNDVQKIDEFPMFLVYGWCASIVLFVVEIVWFKISGSETVSGFMKRIRKKKNNYRTV